MTAADMQDTLERIASAYPSVAGPNNCPPSPHACDKCETYYLLAEFATQTESEPNP